MSREGLRLAFKYGDWKPTELQWLYAGSCVQPEEQSRISQFVFQRDAKAAISGRLLMRKAISTLLGISYADIKLSRTSKGKPYLKNPTVGVFSDFNFNLSHQGDYAVVAAETDYLVGIDTMKVQWPSQRTVDQFFKSMRRQLTDHEWSVIESGRSDWERIKLFYRHWCLKESFVKALGIGIGYSMKRLDFHLNDKDLREEVIDTSTTVCIDGFLSSQWLFEESALDCDHIATVALRESSKSPDHESDEPLVIDYMPSPVSPVPLVRTARSFKTLSWDELISGSCPISPVDESFWNSFSQKQESSRDVTKPAVLPD